MRSANLAEPQGLPQKVMIMMVYDGVVSELYYIHVTHNDALSNQDLKKDVSVQKLTN